MANVGGDQMNLWVRFLPLPNDNGLLGGGVNGQIPGQLLVLRMKNYP
jgi:hypothetical protein